MTFSVPVSRLLLSKSIIQKKTNNIDRMEALE
jgi:hypothetical protein